MPERIFTFHSKLGKDDSVANQLDDFIQAASKKDYAEKHPDCLFDDTFYSPQFEVVDIKYSIAVEHGDVYEGAMLIYKC